jgi:23S rRNA (uridine2552-2'-O)-methyltransferase
LASYKRPDHFTKAAKAQGFPARSIFKLEEIDRRVGLLKQGQRVLDLGCAPGSWSLYACTRIGDRGRLLSVDLQPIAQVLPKNATFIQGDALALSRDTLAASAPYDVVLSDMAPKTTGNRQQDQARSFNLFSFAVDMAEALGGKGSSFVGKIFMGPDFEEARKRLRLLFDEVRVLRPETVRSSSFEIFLVGLGKRAAPAVLGHGDEPAAAAAAPLDAAAPPAAPAPPDSPDPPTA